MLYCYSYLTISDKEIGFIKVSLSPISLVHRSVWLDYFIYSLSILLPILPVKFNDYCLQVLMKERTSKQNVIN